MAKSAVFYQNAALMIRSCRLCLHGALRKKHEILKEWGSLVATKMDLPYLVINPQGQPVMEAAESCRYPRSVELGILEAGYTIKLNGKRITKSEIRKEVKRNE